MRMSFTSTTSARITNSEDKRPSSWRPDRRRLRLPVCAYLETRDQPMIKPKHHGLKCGSQEIVKSAPLNPAVMNDGTRAAPECLRNLSP